MQTGEISVHTQHLGDNLCGKNGSSDSCLVREFAIHHIHNAPGESMGMGNLSSPLLPSLLQHLQVTYILMSVGFNLNS